MQQTVSTILGGQAAPRTLAHNGKQYHCRPFKLRLQSEIERRLESAHRDLLLGARGSEVLRLPPEAQALLLARHADGVLAGRFRFGGQEYQRWIQTYEGAVAVVAVLFGCPDEEADELLSSRGEEVAAMISVTMRESLSPAQLAALERAEKEAAGKEQQAGAGQENADPNA
jgi:hypothetical protein